MRLLEFLMSESYRPIPLIPALDAFQWATGFDALAPLTPGNQDISRSASQEGGL